MTLGGVAASTAWDMPLVAAEAAQSSEKMKWEFMVSEGRG